MFAVWITTLFLLDAATGREVCYERLGCFTDDPPWSGIPGRELAGLPSPPAAVNTNFLLYTRDNTMKYQKISPSNPSTIKASNFRAHRKTRFIIHGHLGGVDLPWISNMCRVWCDYCLTVVVLVFESENIHRHSPLIGL
uniref:Triacylglycerol lipase n=1 Tax=Anser brachyrhynchus TaxID=132585 RepID=A0A8B9BCF8_9AVES